MFCSVIQLFSSWQRLQSLTEKKKVANDGDDREVEINEEEAFEVEGAPLFYT